MIFDLHLISDSEVHEEEFVGRDQEWNELVHALSTWPTGTRLVTVSGAPGIGKTCFAARLLKRAHALGYVVAAGASDHPTSMTRSEAFTDAIDHCLRHTSQGVFDEADPKVLAGLFSTLRSSWQHTYSSDAADVRHACELARSLLVKLAGERGLVVFCDDMQWADPISLAFLRMLVLAQPPARIVIMVAYRPVQASAELLDVIALAERSGVAWPVELGPLSPPELDRLLPAGVGPVRRRSLRRDSDGNPGVIRELARAAAPSAAHGVQPRGEELHSGTPPLVSGSDNELRHLSRVALLAAHAASVCGDPFDASMVAYVAETTTTISGRAIKELLAEAIAEQNGTDCFRFRDPVVRAVAYHSASAGWRQDAHARAGLILRTYGASASRQAWHLEHTAIPGDTDSARVLVTAAEDTMFSLPPRAMRWLSVAARVLRGKLDAKANAMVAQALALAGRLPESVVAYENLWRDRETLPAHVRLTVAEGLVRVHRWLGHYGDAKAIIDDAMPGVGRSEGLGLRIENLAIAVANGSRQTLSLASDLVKTDWSQIAGTSTAHAFSLLAAAWLSQGRKENADEWARGAAEVVRQLADDDLIRSLELLLLLGIAESRLGRPDEAVNYFSWGHRLAGEHCYGYLRSRFSLELAKSCVDHGDLGMAVQHAAEAVQVATGSNNQVLLAEASMFQSGLPDSRKSFDIKRWKSSSPRQDLAGEEGSVPIIASRTLSLLSGREEQIAQLVSRGRTNQQIAREIGLSHKTVETYLGRIFKKLGISARTQIAHLVGAASGP
jgi:DNA-binding CsgD family transcriptional regulator